MNISEAMTRACKERIILATGALSRLSETWAVAVPILDAAKGIARNVFNIGPGNGPLLGHNDGQIESTDEFIIGDFSWDGHVENNLFAVG